MDEEDPMETATLSSVLGELYTAPLDAAIRAEREYRRIWASWLTFKKSLVTDTNGALLPGINLSELLNTAPVVTVDGKVEVAITMRIASVKQVEVGVQGGLSLGPIYASGSFGFLNRSSAESTLQASTSVVLSNANRNLVEYLGDHQVKVTDPATLDKAIKFLETGK